MQICGVISYKDAQTQIAASVIAESKQPPLKTAKRPSARGAASLSGWLLLRFKVEVLRFSPWNKKVHPPAAQLKIARQGGLYALSGEIKSAGSRTRKRSANGTESPVAPKAMIDGFWEMDVSKRGAAPQCGFAQ